MAKIKDSYLDAACNKYNFAEVRSTNNTFKAVILHFDEGSLRIHVIK